MSEDSQQQPLSAIALSYDKHNAPTVTAKGTGELAEQIIALAKEHGIPLFENAYLTQLLVLLDLGNEIPEELYVAVAEIIAFAYWLNNKVPEGHEGE
jgi:flagellar biosynthesis protein